MREKEVKTKNIGRLLFDSGFRQVRFRGSHQIWSDGKSTISLTYPTINRMVAKRISKMIRENHESASA